MKKSFWIWIPLFIAACSTPENESAVPTIASWNGISIDSQSFEEEYIGFASVAPIQDSFDSRKNYAIGMLERKIITEIGQVSSLDTLKEVKLDIRRKWEAALRRVWLEKIAEPKLKTPTEEDIRQAFSRSNTRLILEQIYARSETDIREYERRLRQGESFEQVAQESMIKAGVPDSSYKMGWVQFEMMDEAPEAVAFGLSVTGEISKPIASLRGWHIFRLVQREETFFADGTSYANARENLAFKIYQRRLEEIIVPFTDSLMTSHSLTTYMDRLRQTWFELMPLIPNRAGFMEMVTMNKAFMELRPTSLDRSTPLALVDGKPFTFGQFLDRLPDIPLEMLQPNLRGALEIAIRDSVLAARAQADGMARHPDVLLAEGMARNTALYYATLRAAADTMNIETQMDTWYERWKSSQYIDLVRSDVRYHLFADSSQAWNVIRSYQASADWDRALQESAEYWDVYETTISNESKSGLPEHTLPIPSETTQRMLSGPWPREGKWALIEALGRETISKPIEAVSTELKQTMLERLPEVVHQTLLPKNYRREDVVINEKVLKSLLQF